MKKEVIKVEEIQVKNPRLKMIMNKIHNEWVAKVPENNNIKNYNFKESKVIVETISNSTTVSNDQSSNNTVNVQSNNLFKEHAENIKRKRKMNCKLNENKYVIMNQ